MSMEKEISQERRELIESIDEIALELRKGCLMSYAGGLLENASDEAFKLSRRKEPV